jgi:hypothetical protein
VRAPLVALAFALAAAFSAWNPLAAPFGLVVGLGAIVLSARALRAPRLRPAAWAALAVSILAALGSAIVLARTAGVGRGPGGADIVRTPAPAEVEASLGAAGGATKEARDRASAALPAPSPPPAGGAPKPQGTSGKR